MNTIRKRNRIVLCLCSILVMFASIFAFIPLNKETKVVKADTSYSSYFSSDIILPLCYYDKVSDTEYIQMTETIFAYCAFNFYNGPAGISFQLSTQANDPSVYNYHYFCSDFLINDINTVNTYYHTLIKDTNNVYRYSLFSVRVSSLDFDCRPLYFTITNDVSGYQGINSITYYDENGNYLSVNAVFLYDANYADVMDKFFLSPRTYYLNPDAVGSADFRDGYSSGYNAGVQQGESSGYNKGYSTGKDDGYWIGYDEALNNTNKYSFTSLISAVIDVPVQTFTSLFNFEILGVNLSGFFLGLLTCCIVIGVIRLLL